MKKKKIHDIKSLKAKGVKVHPMFTDVYDENEKMTDSASYPAKTLKIDLTQVAATTKECKTSSFNDWYINNNRYKREY